VVNHVLPYSRLFEPNVAGTAELIRIALTSKIKPYAYVSTGSVGGQIEPSAFTEDADIRVISPTRRIDSGYPNSKWAGEVLLREANELAALPVGGVSLRHDPGRHHLRGSAQRGGQLHPNDAFPAGHRHRARLVLSAGRRWQPAARPLRRGYQSNSFAEAIAALGAGWSTDSRLTT